MSDTPAVMEAMPIALSLPTVPIVRPIIGTNTYRQVCKNRGVPVKIQNGNYYHWYCVLLLPFLTLKCYLFSVKVQQTLEARAASFVGPPPAFVTPGEHNFLKCPLNQSISVYYSLFCSISMSCSPLICKI